MSVFSDEFLDAQIASLKAEINQLKDERSSLLMGKQDLLEELDDRRAAHVSAVYRLNFANNKNHMLAEELARANEENKALKEKLRIVQASSESVWFWQGDGEDKLDNLSCPVIMSADTARALVGSNEKRPIEKQRSPRGWHHPWRKIYDTFTPERKARIEKQVEEENAALEDGLVHPKDCVCKGAGWVWRQELPHTSDWDGSSDDTRYDCPWQDEELQY